jgi:hypothetical protein
LSKIKANEETKINKIIQNENEVIDDEEEEKYMFG